MTWKSGKTCGADFAALYIIPADLLAIIRKFFLHARFGFKLKYYTVFLRKPLVCSKSMYAEFTTHLYLSKSHVEKGGKLPFSYQTISINKVGFSCKIRECLLYKKGKVSRRIRNKICL